MPPANN
jgi:hypothetical protein